jgi:hypothetical protein
MITGKQAIKPAFHISFTLKTPLEYQTAKEAARNTRDQDSAISVSWRILSGVISLLLSLWLS